MYINCLSIVFNIFHEQQLIIFKMYIGDCQFVSVFFESHSCDTPPHHLNPLNSEVIVVSYEGGPIRCDYVAFTSFNDPDLVSYELMVNPLYHEDPDCAISLLYRSTLTSKELKVRRLHTYISYRLIVTHDKVCGLSLYDLSYISIGVNSY